MLAEVSLGTLGLWVSTAWEGCHPGRWVLAGVGQGELALEPSPGLPPHATSGASAALLLPEMKGSAPVFCPAAELSATFKTHTHTHPGQSPHFLLCAFICLLALGTK